MKIKFSILLLLFVTLIVVSVIISNNYFDVIIQSNIHIDKEIVTVHNFHIEADIEIQTQQNIRRILVDTQINTWTVNEQSNP